jgi:diketogulonate reductase-like aldo/keto reductase
MKSNWNRREVIAAAAALTTAPYVAMAEERKMIARPIPASGEPLPMIGLGTYQVFDVDSTRANIESRRAIVERLTGSGGSMIDTSPMYRRSEKVIGDVIENGSPRDDLFLATKVWTDGEQSGVAQMQRSAELMQTDVVDLMQVHNLRDTEIHLKTIHAWQEEGRIRYNGLTHYNKGALEAMTRAMRRHKPDFIQINYSLGEREADQSLLPMAADMGVAVLINRPFQSGALFRAVSGEALPEWARDFSASWGQFFLKFIISHPAVTCVIPATSKPHHMEDNLEAGFGVLPDNATREKMIRFMAEL